LGVIEIVNIDLILCLRTLPHIC